jgi:hypothetical protein
MLASLGPRPLSFLFLELCHHVFYSVPSPSGFLKSIFCPYRALAVIGWVPAGLCPRQVASLCCFSFMDCRQWHCTLGLVFPGLDTPGLLPSRIRSSRLQEDLDCPQGVLPPKGLVHFGDWAPFGAPPCNASNAYSKPGLFNPWGFTARTLPHDACFVGALSTAIVAPGALPHGPPLPFLDHQAWTPLCFHHPGCNICARMT